MLNTAKGGACLIIIVATVFGQCEAQTQTAIWKEQEAKLTHLGATTRYSCAGLKRTIRQVLLALGARKDARVDSIGCNGPEDVPALAPSVKLKWASLYSTPSGAVDAWWKPVDLVRDSGLNSADCELLR